VNTVRAVLRTRTRAEWLERFADDDVCLTTVYEPDEVHRDPHVAAGAAAARRATPHVDAPALGADTDAVLERAGVTADRRASLRAAGVI
jgi:crotonobetainyl-CoA:carnitine CoA-transferase CaiB-like acyl-CoA transferase